MFCDIMRHNRMARLAEKLEAKGLIDWYDCDDIVVMASCGSWQLEMTPEEQPDADGDLLDVVASEPIEVHIWNDTDGTGCIHVCKDGRHVANFLRKWCGDATYRQRLEDNQTHTPTQDCSGSLKDEASG